MRRVHPALLFPLLLCASLRLGGEVYQNRRLVRGDWQADWVAGMTPVNQLWQEAYDADGPVRDYYASSAGDWSLGIQEDWVRGSDWGGGIGGILYSQPEYGNATTAKYYNYDGRGDVVALTSNVGNITYAAAYNAYGQHATVTSGNVTTTGTQEVGTDTDLFRLTTKEEDPTGLSYQINRYLSLTDNNWLSRDPLGLATGPNPYTYVEQNNWTKFDPDGREALTLGAGVLALGDAIPEPAEPVFWVLTGLTVIGGGAVVVHNVENSAPAPAPTTAAPPAGPVQKQPITTPPTTAAPPIPNATGGSAAPAIPNTTGGTPAAPLPNATPGGTATQLPITTPGQPVTPSGGAAGADILNSVLKGDAAGGRGPGSNNTPTSTLPRAPNGDYLPDPNAEGAHTTLGTQAGRNGPYTQGATFDENGEFQGRTDVTDHGRADHTDPHFHPATSPNGTGPAQPIPST